jgi:manganese transport protein
MSDRTRKAIVEALEGKRRGLRALLPMTGPAVVASVAYMDPGNFATNIQAGASYGYGLLWVVLLANMVAMLFQSMSARIGIVTGHNLAELSRMHFPPKIVWMMWGASEVAAMATDLAEFLGGAIGLSLLLHLPLLAGMVVTGVVTWAILGLQRRGFRPLELLIGVLVGAIGLCYVIELAIRPPDWGLALFNTFVPSLTDRNAVTIAVAIIGCTVMPHAIYLHSGLTQGRGGPRSEADRRRLIRFSNTEVVIALSYAGLVNIAMVMAAAAAFHAGHSEIAEIETAYHTLIPVLGIGAASVFLFALMASGISSSAVGTMAGQMIMQGFLRRQIPSWVRRLVTMLPAFIIIALGFDATRALVLSQVVLSFVLPVPMIALLLLSRRRDVMGDFATGAMMTPAALIAAILIIALNVVLVLELCDVSLI